MIHSDTIYALSTPYGKSGIAIIKISGPRSLKVLKNFNLKKIPIERKATLCKIYKKDLEVLDEIIVIYFSKNNSYTGEDTIELQTHGGIAIIHAIFDQLSSSNYLRLANNGEFTQRALLNNKISLNKAESIIELISAESEHQRKVAIQHYNGALEENYLSWRSSMIALLAIAEAYIDFPDDLLNKNELDKLNQQIRQLKDNFQTNIGLFGSANKLMNGINLCIVGSTNVGKSTLMNILSQANTSIISNIQGTTRDVIKTKLEILGVPVILYDTAGIRNTLDQIEKIGIEKGKQAVKNADILIIMLEASDSMNFNILGELKNYINQDATKILILINKIDLFVNLESLKIILQEELTKIHLKFEQIIYSSLKQNKYKKTILDAIQKLIQNIIPTSSANLITNIRHQEKLKKCAYCLSNAINNQNLELKAEELRYAAKELGVILGDINAEEVLDQIFSSFCIGK